ncbi:MAG: diguanylate cyclase [Nitrospirae bacterium]|nr:diguanylate cyclase [Nitrospirota bacterium]
MDNARIMIVEDEGITSAYIKNRLEKFGYIVTSISSSSAQAIENAERDRPDLILMDIKIKGERDGVETAYEIQNRFNIPVIYLTAHSDPKTLEHAKMTEPYAYITKPFEPELTNFTIQMALYKHKTETKLKELVHYDFLTGLPNRALFIDRFDQALRQSKRNGTIIALLLIDIDEFKCINDRMGHDAGDVVLKDIAVRIQNHIRDTDTAARLGGDEFVVILTNLTNPRDAETVALNIIVSIGKPFRFDVPYCAIGASIGISFYPEDGFDTQTLMKKADAAMYHAKENGKNTYHLYTGSNKTDSGDLRVLLALSLKFVAKHKGKWAPDDWIDFILELKKNGIVIQRHFEAILGTMLDTLKRFYLVQHPCGNIEEVLPLVCGKVVDFISETKGAWTVQDWEQFMGSIKSMGIEMTEQMSALLYDVVESVKALCSLCR